MGISCITLSVNLERCQAIVFPLRHFRWKRYLLPASVVFAVVYNLPKYFELRLEFSPEGRPKLISTGAYA